MFGWLYTAFGLVVSGVQWLIGFEQRQLGKQEQQLDDAKKVNKQLLAENNALATPADAADELHKHKF